MISRPTTDQLLLDVRRELLEVVLPDVQSEHVKVTVQMLENILRNAATRAAHEIAWMREETLDIEAYARDVVAMLPADAKLGAALARLDAAPRESVDLRDVVETYSRAGEAFSCSLEVAMRAGHAELSGRAAELLATRNQHELEINGEWAMVGRG